MKSLAKNLTLLAFSMLVTLFAAELIVRLFVPVRNVGPSFSEHDPTYGKRLKANFRCERITPEFTMRFSTNSLGFRGPEPDAFPRNTILFLGDSYTEGYGVNDGEEFPALVGEGLRKLYGDSAPPVVNKGVGDSGNGRCLKLLRRGASHFEPRLVVLQLTGNDFFDNVYEGLFSLNDRDSLIEHPVPEPGFSRYAQTAIESIPGLSYSRLIGLTRQLSWVLTKGDGETVAAIDRQKNGEQLTYRIVNEMLAECTDNSWPVILLLFDMKDEWTLHIKEIAARYSADMIIMASAAERPDLYYSTDGHINAKGHKHVASQIVAMIEKHGLLKK